MDMVYAKNMVKVCALVAQMPVGEGWVRSSDIAQWCGVPHATTYRYLPKLKKLGYLSSKVEGYRAGKLILYKITPQGIDYLKSFKEFML